MLAKRPGARTFLRVWRGVRWVISARLIARANASDVPTAHRYLFRPNKCFANHRDVPASSTRNEFRVRQRDGAPAHQ